MAKTPRTTRPADDEQAFLTGYDASRYPRPSLAVDLVLMTVENGALKALLLRRGEHPGKGRWALPGGFVGIDESPDDAARRVLRAKAGLRGVGGVGVEQLYTFGKPGRDPRTRVVSVAYFALVPAGALRTDVPDLPEPLTLATVRASWSGETGGPASALDAAGADLPLAFDHADMLGMALLRLRGRVSYTPVAYGLLPAEFTLRMLQEVHEVILGRPLNKDAFRRRLLASGELEATGRLESSVDHRPAELYRRSPGAPSPLA